jgi:hypothetical protein
MLARVSGHFGSGRSALRVRPLALGSRLSARWGLRHGLQHMLPALPIRLFSALRYIDCDSRLRRAPAPRRPSRRNPGSRPTHASDRKMPRRRRNPRQLTELPHAADRPPEWAFFRPVDRVSVRQGLVASAPARHQHSTICSVLLTQPDKHMTSHNVEGRAGGSDYFRSVGSRYWPQTRAIFESRHWCLSCRHSQYCQCPVSGSTISSDPLPFSEM